MKKAILLLTITTAFISLPINPVYAEDSCKDKGDDCAETCNTRYEGDTEMDGLARNACRFGCGVAEAGCIVKEWWGDLDW
jgi:hypothetical protein